MNLHPHLYINYLMDSISSLIPENILYTLNKIVFGPSDGRLSASLIKKRG